MQLLHIQESCSSNPPVVTGICDPNNYRAWHQHRINMCLRAVLKLVSVLLLNMFKVLGLSGLFVCLEGLVKIFSAWGMGGGHNKLLDCGLLGGITTQVDTAQFPLTFFCQTRIRMPCFIAQLMTILVLMGMLFMIIWDMFHRRISLSSVLLLPSAAAIEFCEWLQVGIDVYISHRKCNYQVKPHSSQWF